MASDPELWTVAERTRANLAAMRLADSLARHPRELSAGDRAAIMAYSGWGGLSLEKAQGEFPEGFPRPEKRGLIHEYYTPRALCREIARVVRPLLPSLARADGSVYAIEPSCGIGRFVDAFTGPGFDAVEWHAVEYSAVSAALFRAAFPGVDLTEGPFERWVAEYDEDVFGQVNLVIGNPPYGARGASKTEDADRSYRRSADNTDSDAYAYFLRRAQDLLAPNGLGVWVIPSGFVTGTSKNHQELRRSVLLRHHVASAFRLPTGIFAGVTGAKDPNKVSTSKFNLNIDVVFLRSRGGALSEVDSGDRFILDGNYYEEHPEHILGREVGGHLGHEHRVPRGEKSDEPAYQIVGEFTGLPDLVERPMCSACRVLAPARPAANRARPEDAKATPEIAADHWVTHAAALGRRARAFLGAVAQQDLEVPSLAWEELHTGLQDWAKKWGAPSRRVDLVKLAQANDDVQQFLAVFERDSTELIPALRKKPVWEPRYTGRRDDVVALATFAYGQRRAVSRADLGGADVRPLFAAGWCEDEPGKFVPGHVYYYGDLWPKYERAKLRGDLGDRQAAEQAQRLLDAIKPAIFDDIEGVSPRQGWVPLELIAEWLAPRNIGGEPPPLVRSSLLNPGLVYLEGKAYEDDASGVALEIETMLGWINHDKDRFRPKVPEKKFRAGDFVHVALDPDPDAPKTLGTVVKIRRSYGAEVAAANIEKDGDAVFEVAIEDQPNIKVSVAQIHPMSLDEVRLAVGKRWDREFRAWVGADAARRELIERVYQRTFQGYRAPKYEELPLPIARWTRSGRSLHGYQSAALRRLLAGRGGLLAFDVGLGKTYTGLAMVARARQEGWAKRPVVLVPNSIVWKWVKDFKDVLPDYNVGVIGSKKTMITRGPRAGMITSETDSAAERAATWSRFQSGEFDVVLMTYSALPRTLMATKDVAAYVEKTSAIQRQITLRKKSKKKKLSEREDAVLEEGVAGWVAEMLELPKNWKPDPGIKWDDIGVDLLVVDEAQNYKNLYLPEPREGGVPKFMGNPGAGSSRAWQLDFRTATVRRKTGGAGIVLLSATPAKNSPLEFYNLIQYVDHDAFAKLGVTDPEQFIDRYCKLEIKDVIGVSGEVEQRAAVVGFENLHELRDIVFRYGDFKTAEQVALKIPEGRAQRVQVDLDERQEAKFARYISNIEAMRANPRLGNPLGLMARLNLVAIHADLDEGYGWKASPGRPAKYEDGELVDPGERPTQDARDIDDPHSPKFDALAREILKTRNCGHIVFIDNLAAHVWIKMVLVEAGIPANRIAILNAEAAKAVDDRLRIGQEFNGVPATINGEPVADLSQAGPDDVITEPVEPKYDVLIANAVAYEGMDLQTRTCAVHHIDLPYEPATLQQRNGRAVRQGNKLASLPINYFLANKSLDGFRFNLIQGKLGWMNALIAGTARSTNNPGAQETMSVDDMLIELSRDPAQTAALQAAQRERRQDETNKKLAKAASATLRSAAGRFELARETSDPMRARTLRSDGDKLLETLTNVPPAAWPWGRWAGAVREHSMLVPPGGQSPVYETLRVAYPHPVDPSVTEFVEFGRSTGQSIGARRAGSAVWRSLVVEDVIKFGIRPEHVVTETRWPAEDDDVASALRTAIHKFYLGPRAWTELGWAHATNAFVERAWARFSTEILARMESFASGTNRFRVPVLFADGVIGFGLLPREGQRAERVFPPTSAGWEDFLERAVAGDKLKGSPKRTEIAEVADWWWGRKTPRDLFTAAEFAEAMDALRRAVVDLAAVPTGDLHSNDRHNRRLAVVGRAIDANMLGPLDDATMRAVAEAFEHVDDRRLTQGAGVARVQSLIALRRRADALAGRAPSVRAPLTRSPGSERSPAPATSRRSAIPSTKTPSVRAPASSGASRDAEWAAAVAEGKAEGHPTKANLRAWQKAVAKAALAGGPRSSPPSSTRSPSARTRSDERSSASQSALVLPSQAESPAPSARAEAIAQSHKPSTREKVRVPLAEGGQADVEVLGREGNLIVHRSLPTDTDGPFAVTYERFGLRLRAFPTLADAMMYAWDASEPDASVMITTAATLHMVAQDTSDTPGAKVRERLAQEHANRFAAHMDAKALTREARYLRAKGPPSSGPRPSTRPASLRRVAEDLDDLGFGEVDIGFGEVDAPRSSRRVVSARFRDEDLGFGVMDDDLGFGVM